MLPPLAVLFAWPVISIIFFRTMRLPLAILVTIFGGYLLLPEATVIDFPLLPALDKHTVPVLSVLLLIALGIGHAPPRKLAGLLPRHWLGLVLLAVLVGGAFMTVRTNPDPLVYGPLFLPGMRTYDAFSEVLGTIMMVLPMLVARKYLAHPAMHVLILQVLCIAGLAYSLPALFEVRMSPQLNNWIYGFFPHSFAQHVRGGGFRPLVFLSHGLLLAIFLSATILAALGLSRIDTKRRTLFLWAALWLLVTLILAKSLGALILTLALAPVVFLASARRQLLVAAIVAGIFLGYPVLRSSQIVPVERIAATVETFSSDRAESFRVRLTSEDRLLEKAQQRPLFGWGKWGRNRVYDEKGRSITITDGAWTGQIGTSGWVGYLAFFGLLTMPLLLLFRNARRYGIGMETSVLALILAGNLADCIPNASITPLTWVIAGALWGRLELRAEAVEAAPQTVSNARPGYRRAPPVRPKGMDAPARGTAYTRQTVLRSRNRSTSR